MTRADACEVFSPKSQESIVKTITNVTTRYAPGAIMKYFDIGITGKHSIKTKRILLILTFLIVLSFISIVVWQKISENKPQSVASSNAIRVKLSVPIIEANMHPVYSIKTLLFQHWEPDDLTPKDYNALHVTKRTGKDPLSDAIKEIDVYLKKDKNDSIIRLRIMSDIFGNTLAKRKGWLTFPDTSFTLDEYGIDSVAFSWKLFYPVKNKE